MDPVSAFGVAAGVIQVVDFSLRALKRCQEIYKDGSLAEHRNTAEVVGHLADTTNRLRATVDQAPKPISLGDCEILDLSMKCSETAAELLTELEKLKLKPGVSFRQAVRKSNRAYHRKRFIDEIQGKLEKYQTILNTRILVDLKTQLMQQPDEFHKKLDQNGRDLIIAMYQGRDTVAQLIADQGLAIRDHFDRGLDSRALNISHGRAQEQFKDSLFFSEMFSRQENIAEEHQGTYQWIFQPPYDGESQEVDGNRAVAGKGNDGEARDGRKRGQQWSNFVTWLEHGKGIYWLNGKPGSGKSTLMKFTASNIWENAASNAAMVNWAGDNEVVTASFYFWSLGSTGLQKNVQGLSRSLLYQFASQRQDLISILMQDLQRSAQESDPSRALPIYEWTERRLRSVLEHFLDNKPSSVSLFILIDGLDEMAGDEKILIDTLRLLNDTPHTKLCVASRPEQIFRQGFSTSPQIRLQDLNHDDIEKTATESLLPALKGCFPRDEKAICRFIQNVISKAEGVFLWLELVMKDIKRGARYNEDSLLELGERLKITPNSIDGLYEQMLSRLDKIYLQDAGKYFRFLMAHRGQSGIPTTLMEIVCAESVPWDHIRRRNTAWFQSLDFFKACQHVETRLLTRCAGLVEVEQHSTRVLRGTTKFTAQPRFYDDYLPANQEEQSICYQLREVKFIHKSAIDFLQAHRPAFLQNRDGNSAACLCSLRGITGVLSILPIVILERRSDAAHDYRMVTTEHIQLTIHSLASYADSSASFEKPGLGNVAVEMVDDVYQIIGHVDASINGPGNHWYKNCKPEDPFALQIEGPPFRNVHGFAAFLGCRNYVSYHRSLRTYSLEESNYLLACTIRGLIKFSLEKTHVLGHCALIEDLLCEGAYPNLSLDVREGYGGQAPWVYTISAWGAFLYMLVRKLPLIVARGPFVPNGPTLDQVPKYFKALMESFLSRNADVNTSIRHLIHFVDGAFKKTPRYWKIGIEETPLSYLKRALNSKEHHMLSPLVNLLRPRNAIERRRFHFVAIDYYSGMRTYLVPEEESQRLCEVWPRRDGHSEEDLDSLYSAFLELKASLIRHNIMNETMVFNWKSSW